MADLNFILLYVDDVATSVGFYEKVLGRAAIESSPTFAMTAAAPGIMLGLWRRDGVAPPANAPGGSEIAFTVENEAAVEATIARWQALGARIQPSLTQYSSTSSRSRPLKRTPTPRSSTASL